MITTALDFKGILHINGLLPIMSASATTNCLTSESINTMIRQLEPDYLRQLLGDEIALPFIEYLKEKGETDTSQTTCSDNLDHFWNIIRPKEETIEEDEEEQENESLFETNEKWEKLISCFKKYDILPTACYIYFHYVVRNPKSIGSQDNTTPKDRNVYNNVSIYLAEAWNKMVEMNFELYDTLKKDSDFAHIPDNRNENIFSLRNPYAI